MTDSKTVVEDLAAWLTAVWDEEEARLTHPTFCGPVWPTTAQLLARIAADRKILALHSYHMVPSLDSRLQPIPGSRRPHCDTCASQDESGEDWPCVTIRLLAEPQADKAGFRSEWLVERQGVEQ